MTDQTRVRAADRLFSRKLDLRNGRIELVHGAGGKASAQLFEEVFLPAFANAQLGRGDDSAALSGTGRIKPDCGCGAAATARQFLTPGHGGVPFR